MVLGSEYFKLIQQAGFTAVRVPIRWSAHAQEVAPYQDRCHLPKTDRLGGHSSLGT